MRSTYRQTRDYLISLMIAILLSLLIGAGIMALCGCNPLDGYAALLNGALGKPRSIGNTLEKASTLCLTGLAMCLAAQAGIFNVGGEGQLYLGAIAAAFVGARLQGPAWLVIALSLLAAMVVGGLYAFIPGALKVYLNVDEVITTIMGNSIAIFLCSYLTTGPLRTTEKGIEKGTAKVGAMFGKVIKLSNLTTGIFITLVIILVVWFLMTRSATGYEMKLTGDNATFARYGGIATKRTALWCMTFSGVICGIVGMLQVFGLQGRFITNISDEFYFDGMLVAMIMRYSPFGVIPMSLFFAVLKTGGQSMQKVGVASEVIDIVQSVIIFFMAAEGGIRTYFTERAEKKRIRKVRAEQAAAAAKEGN